MDDPFLQSAEWRAVRMMVIERDGAKCACCGRTAADGIRINVDHIKPRARYPLLALSLENLQVLCAECNHGKGNKYETDWRGNFRVNDVFKSDGSAEQNERMRQLEWIKKNLSGSDA